MDFGSLLSVAQKNAKNTNPSAERSKFYSTKFEPPKKVSKEKKLSDGVKRFLAQREQQQREENERKKREYEQLMALRSERDKNKIKKMLKVTKSANRSVLEDAVNKNDTAVTLDGPEQPDEDDYGYTSNEASALYKNLMEKYKSLPEDKMFSKPSLSGGKTADLMSTKNRVRDAIERERDDERMGRKRTHSSITNGGNDSSDQKYRSRKNLYDPKAERDADERKKKELEEEKRQKMKTNKRPPPPVMDFQKLLKLAEEKQHQPIHVEMAQKPKEPERLLTGKEKREMEQRKKQLEGRERRRNGIIPSKLQTNVEPRKLDSQQTINGRIPKLNGSNPSVKSLPPDARKPGSSIMREPPIRPAANGSSSHKPLPSKVPSSMNTFRPSTSQKPSNAPQTNGRPSIESKTKIHTHDEQQNGLKQTIVSKSATKLIDSRNVKPREFPPKDVVKTREFPPRDMIKSREFPPRDMQRGNISKNKQSVASKRRILEDSEDEYDSEMDDFIDDDDVEADYSSEIKRIFGYDRSRYRDEDDDVDNMESSFAQQQREEFISKKIGLQEDLEDIRLEAEEKKRKAAKRRHH